MGRRACFIAAGAAFGLLTGALGPVSLIAACVWDGRIDRAEITEPVWVTYLVVLAALGAANGAAGAWDGWRSGQSRPGPVAWVPLALLLFPTALFAQYPSDSKGWGSALLVVGILAPFVWVAGRVGQEIGVRGRPAEPGAAADGPRL